MKRTVTLGALCASIMTTLALSLTLSVGAANYLGTAGPRGATGAQGAQGIRGERGQQGKRGRSGKSGVDGANGASVVREEACSNDLYVPLPYC
jgi:hypothetical protein